MERYGPSGTGTTARRQPARPQAAVYFAVPPVRVPLLVEIDRGVLWARPVVPNAPLITPPDGTWRNFADTEPNDLPQIGAIASRFGPLTPAAADKGEELTVWQNLIDDLRQLAGAWTANGDRGDSIAVSNASMSAERMQFHLCEAHQNNGGRFVSFGPGGWMMVTADMAQWWRLTAIRDVSEGAPLRRCRFCGSWFSLTGQRADNRFCSSRHRSAFHQKRQPPSEPWAEMI